MAKTDALENICPGVEKTELKTMLVEIITLVNDLKSKYNAAVTLINELKTDHNAHLAASSMHYDGAAEVTDSTNTVSSSDATVTSESDVDNS